MLYTFVATHRVTFSVLNFCSIFNSQGVKIASRGNEWWSYEGSLHVAMWWWRLSKLCTWLWSHRNITESRTSMKSLDYSKFIYFLDMTARLEHSQCPLVEMGSTTSLHIWLFTIQKSVTLILKSMEKQSARLLHNKQTHRPMTDPLHALLFLTSLKVWVIVNYAYTNWYWCRHIARFRFRFTLHSVCTAGDVVQVVYRSGTDTTPLWATTSYYVNGFTGFRI